ncbi:hypothetical protein JOL79_11880 [Microbispora sp. RL4-1S]|uniref:Uncharacterized protein n=1 Tax=Microbispora oryzae TaxID=2806554 RepID=A0A940WGS5_9ACTN|nr:hypothetical protein [Microbispora oryzae]MBP2704513.1 hypothetical protein [Microbispora oryzae]
MRASLSVRLARSVLLDRLRTSRRRRAPLRRGRGLAPWVLLVGGLTVLGAATTLAGRERSPAAVIGLVLAAQIFLHELLAQPVRPLSAPRVPVAAMPGAHDHALSVYAQGHALSVHAGMFTAHLVAALLTGWWLSRGEALLWSILRGIGAGAADGLVPLLTLLTLLTLLWAGARVRTPGGDAVRADRPTARPYGPPLTAAGSRASFPHPHTEMP